MQKPWANLASRLVRILLARKGLKTGDVPELLAAQAKGDIDIDGQALSELIAKERVDLELFLRILLAINDAIPERWVGAIKNNKTGWKALCASIVAVEVENFPTVNNEELAERLAGLHGGVSSAVWQRKISDGDLSLAEFMALLNEVGSTSLSRYLDWNDVLNAARMMREMAH